MVPLQFRIGAVWRLVKTKLKRIEAAAVGILLATAPGQVGAQSLDPTTTLQLAWTERFDRISPNPKNGILTRKAMTLTLEGGNRLAQSFSTRSGRYRKNTERRQQLGKGWRVASENVLVRTENYPNHVRVMTVRVDGKSCSLGVAHELKGGHSTYIHPMLSRPGEKGVYSQISTQSATCSIR